MDTTLIERFINFADVELGLSPLTLAAYKSDLKLYFEFLDDLGVSPLSASVEVVASYLRALGESGYAIATIHRYVISVQTFYGFLHERGEVNANPIRALDLPKLPDLLPDVLSKENMNKLMSGIDPADRFAPRDTAIVELFYSSGVRVTELVTAVVDNWYPKMGMLRVHGKGSKDRAVPVGGVATRAIEHYRTTLRPQLAAVKCARQSFTDAIFLSRAGLPLTRDAVFKLVQRVAAHAGLRPVHPHTLRHTFASHMLSGGANLRVIQDILGHERLETTQRYTHVDLEHLKKIHRLHPRQ